MFMNYSQRCRKAEGSSSREIVSSYEWFEDKCSNLLLGDFSPPPCWTSPETASVIAALPERLGMILLPESRSRTAIVGGDNISFSFDVCVEDLHYVRKVPADEANKACIAIAFQIFTEMRARGAVSWSFRTRPSVSKIEFGEREEGEEWTVKKSILRVYFRGQAYNADGKPLL